jgi:DNA-binding GntR family transcriptional regulator
MERAVCSKDATAYWKSHIAFHDIFIAASGNEALIGILKTLRMHSMWYRFSYQYYREDLGKSFTVHQQIFEMFGNPQTKASELGALVQHHIEVASERFLAYLEVQKD